MKRINSAEIREALEQLKSSKPDSYRQEKALNRLKELADTVRYEGYLDFDNSWDSDEIQTDLSSFGSQSYAEYLYGK
jgi:hypothetical protein